MTEKKFLKMIKKEKDIKKLKRFIKFMVSYQADVTNGSMTVWGYPCDEDWWEDDLVVFYEEAQNREYAIW